MKKLSACLFIAILVCSRSILFSQGNYEIPKNKIIQCVQEKFDQWEYKILRDTTSYEVAKNKVDQLIDYCVLKNANAHLISSLKQANLSFDEDSDIAEIEIPGFNRVYLNMTKEQWHLFQAEFSKISFFNARIGISKGQYIIRNLDFYSEANNKVYNYNITNQYSFKGNIIKPQTKFDEIGVDLSTYQKKTNEEPTELFAEDSKKQGKTNESINLQGDSTRDEKNVAISTHEKVSEATNEEELETLTKNDRLDEQDLNKEISDTKPEAETKNGDDFATNAEGFKKENLQLSVDFGFNATLFLPNVATMEMNGGAGGGWTSEVQYKFSPGIMPKIGVSGIYPLNDYSLRFGAELYTQSYTMKMSSPSASGALSSGFATGGIKAKKYGLDFPVSIGKREKNIYYYFGLTPILDMFYSSKVDGGTNLNGGASYDFGTTSGSDFNIKLGLNVGISYFLKNFAFNFGVTPEFPRFEHARTKMLINTISLSGSYFFQR